MACTKRTRSFWEPAPHSERRRRDTELNRHYLTQSRLSRLASDEHALLLTERIRAQCMPSLRGAALAGGLSLSSLSPGDTIGTLVRTRTPSATSDTPAKQSCPSHFESVTDRDGERDRFEQIGFEHHRFQL